MHPVIAILIIVAVAAVGILAFRNKERIVAEAAREKADAQAMADKATAAVAEAKAKGQAVIDAVRK